MAPSCGTLLSQTGPLQAPDLLWGQRPLRGILHPCVLVLSSLLVSLGNTASFHGSTRGAEDLWCGRSRTLD